jgi:hypothetical protein
VNLYDQNQTAVKDLSKDAKRLKARLELASLKINSLEQKANQASSPSPGSSSQSATSVSIVGLQPRV